MPRVATDKVKAPSRLILSTECLFEFKERNTPPLLSVAVSHETVIKLKEPSVSFRVPRRQTGFV